MMLVIHWARHNKTAQILANGIRPSFCGVIRDGKKYKGVYAYPFSPHRTLRGNWRRNLKTWNPKRLGNYNGFVFRLVPEDFPLIAGYWFINRDLPDLAPTTMTSMEQLAVACGDFFSGGIASKVDEEGFSYNWEDFEIIVPRLVTPDRIIRIVKDREPKSAQNQAI